MLRNILLVLCFICVPHTSNAQIKVSPSFHQETDTIAACVAFAQELGEVSTKIVVTTPTLSQTGTAGRREPIVEVFFPNGPKIVEQGYTRELRSYLTNNTYYFPVILHEGYILAIMRTQGGKLYAVRGEPSKTVTKIFCSVEPFT